jgi:hypothetical protein
MIGRTALWTIAGALHLTLFGCGAAGVPTASSTQSVANTETAATQTSSPAEPASESAAKRRPVQLGGTIDAAPTAIEQEHRADSVVSAMQPLQVLLGKWNGTSRKAQLDQPEWIWDFQTDRSQPSLLMKSDKGTYIREGRLTFLPDLQKYQFTWKTPEGDDRVLRGDFVQPVQDVAGDDQKKLQRTFKLQLTGEPHDAGEQWQLALQQLENNRYIVEIDRRRGSGAFQRIDTIHTQREGTSFAVSDTDYGEKTCIISQGLGTIGVSYKGQSYWVCCSGCKAAFDEDPQRWIAKWEEKKKMSKEE